MALIFDGYTITGGISPLFAPTNGSHGSVGGAPCDIKNCSGVGASWDPFSFEIPCDCQPAKGDWISASTTTILFIKVARIEYFLCNGNCHGTLTRPGFSLGVEVKTIKWVV
jgi:hypothetical protein